MHAYHHSDTFISRAPSDDVEKRQVLCARVYVTPYIYLPSGE